MLFLVTALVRASEVGVKLSGRKTVAWSSSTMSDDSAEVVASIVIVAKVAHMVADCS